MPASAGGRRHEPATERPGVSIVVVCRNERGRIESCLHSLLAQPADDAFEVIAADGDSTDGTRETIEAMAAHDPRLRLVRNPDRLIAPGRNRGLESARAPLIAFTDADCVAPAGWLRGLVEAQRKLAADEPRLVGVGGGNAVPARAGRFAQAVGIARSNFWGHHGSVQGRTHARPTFVDHLPTVNVLYVKRALEEIGGFDESFGNIGEDVDLSLRLAARGGRFAYVPGCDVEHLLVSGPRAWLAKMVTYGRGRAWLIDKHGVGRLGFRFLVPILFLAYLVVAVAIGFLWPPAWIPGALYVVATAAAAVQAGRAAGALGFVPLVFVAYVLTHVPYAIGEVQGFLRPRERFHWTLR